jgi:protoporphyrinogen oxidase
LDLQQIQYNSRGFVLLTKSYIVFIRINQYLSKNLTLSRRYHVLIVGAGVAGMSAALEMYRNKKDFAIVEKNNNVGGLSTTFSIKEGNLEFRSDNGPHFFSYGRGKVGEFIESVIPRDSMIPVKLRERIFINGKSMDFPVIPKQMLKTFGPSFIARSLYDYIIAVIEYHVIKKQSNTFYEYVVANLGKTLATATSISYLEKIFGIPADELHSDLAKQRFHFLSLSKFIKEIIRNLILLRGIGTQIKKSYINNIYPHNGIGVYSEIIKNQLENTSNPFFFNSFMTKIRHEKNHFTGARVSINGEEQEFHFDYIVESIPIGDFVKLMDPLPPMEIIEAASNLPYRNQIYLFITLNIDKFSEYNSFYFADSDIPFCRVTEMKNYDSKMAPEGKSSLLVEFFCNKGDRISRLTKDELFELTIPYLEKFLLLDKKTIRNYYRFPLEKAYPVYTMTYRKNLDIIMKYLDSFDNLFYIGRTGKFEYISQPRAIEMGIDAARKIIQEKN